MTKYQPYSHCQFCGGAMNTSARTEDGGHRCINCKNVTYQNPIPVAVLIVPCGQLEPKGSVFAVRRGIEPFKGELALPGGFIMKGESWEKAACRETNEELGVVCRGNSPGLERPEQVLTKSNNEGTQILIVGATIGAFHVKDPFVPTEEAMERVIYTPEHDEQLCFPIHREALAKYWDNLEIKHKLQV